MKKIIIILISIASIFIYILFSPSKSIQANEISLDTQCETITEDDIFEFQGKQYTIQEYAASIEKAKKDLHGINVDVQSDSGSLYSKYTIKGDDPIIQIIPRIYFEKEGVNLYIGKEYGFFIETTKEKFLYMPNPNSTNFEIRESDNMRSTIIVFDIYNGVDLEKNIDRAIFKVEVLFELQFVLVKENSKTIYQIGKYSDNNYADSAYQKSATCIFENEKQNNYVVPLYDSTYKAFLSKYYLSDISFGATLSNEQDYNIGDEEYNVNNDYGSFFTRMDYIYEGYYLQNGDIKNVDWWEIGTELLKPIMSVALGKIPLVGSLINILETSLSISTELDKGLADNLSVLTNKNYISEARYQNAYDQINHYGFLTKSAVMTFESSQDISIVYDKSCFAEMQYTINHNLQLGELPNYTRITSEIALKIVDKNMRIISLGKGSNDHMLREPVEKKLELNVENKLFLQKEGMNYFYYIPTYTGNYELNITSDNDIQVEYNEKIQTGKNIHLKIELIENQICHILIKNLSKDRIITNFEFEISSYQINQTITLTKNYIVKLMGSDGFKEIKFSNTNVSLKLLDSTLTLIKSSDSNIIHHDIDNQKKYLVVQNKTSQEIRGTIYYGEIQQQLQIGETIELDMNRGGNLYKFTPPSSNDYRFAIYNNFDIDYEFAIYNSKGESISTRMQSTNEFDIYYCRLNANENYYVGYINEFHRDEKLKLIVNTPENICRWYVNDKEFYGDTLHLKQEETFSIYAMVGDVKIYPYIETDYIIHMPGNKYSVKNNAPILSPNIVIDSPVETELESYISRIKVIVYPNVSINVNPYITSTNNKSNQFQWNTYSGDYTYSIGLKGKFVFDNGENYLFEVNMKENQKNGYIDVPSNMNYSINTLYADIYISEITYEQKYIKNNAEIRTTITLSNSYPNTSNIEENEFYFIPTRMNMMFGGGRGTTTDPYKIYNVWQFNNMRYMEEIVRYGDYESENMIAKHFVLMNNIIIDENFEPLPYLAGSLTGYNNQKKTIKISKLLSGKKYNGVGLFEYVWFGTVSNIIVNIEKEIILNSDYNLRKGGICGYLLHGTISNCEIYVKFIEKNSNLIDSYIGGITGEVLDGTITNCRSVVEIKTYGTAGGIAGNCYSGTIMNCEVSGKIEYDYKNGSITTDYQNVAIGGIVGYLNSSTIKNCKIGSSKNKEDMVISYIGPKNKDKYLKPRMGYIIGEASLFYNEEGSIVETSAMKVDNLQNFKTGGFLGIGGTSHNQLEHTKKNIGKGEK